MGASSESDDAVEQGDAGRVVSCDAVVGDDEGEGNGVGGGFGIEDEGVEVAGEGRGFVS